MTTNAPSPDPGRARELVVVALFTLVGAILRLWSPARLGLIHFDEGIYALAGLWIGSPRGLAGLDPAVVPYAPPGFPLLVGLSYLGLGVSDFSAILVSATLGTLTIPAAAWLAGRSFGHPAGAAAAAFVALSGPHIAFSRMALVDASFLFFWLMAMGHGQRFLERPTPARAAALGLAVGMAQLFKYNGWLSGVIVAAAAAVWLLPRRGAGGRRAAATWGWGCGAALVAGSVYWPWYRFVEGHGGYFGLLAHHWSYLGGWITWITWPGHLAAQLSQSKALSGGPLWLGFGGLAAAAGMAIAAGDHRGEHRRLPRLVVALVCLMVLCAVPHLAFWVPLAAIPAAIAFGTRGRGERVCVLGVCWVVLSLLTPFYHPYARLWLPLEGLGWLFLAGAFTVIREWTIAPAPNGGRGRDLLPWLAGASLAGMVFTAATWDRPLGGLARGVLEPSDSLRQACRSLVAELPEGVRELRAFVRPPVTFYLGMTGRVTVLREPSLDTFQQQASASSWAVLDLALTRQSTLSGADRERYVARWVVVREFPTSLNVPTLLDVDPSAARREIPDREADLILLRPRGAGDVR